MATSNAVRSAAVSLLKGNVLAAALRDGTLSKKQLRSMVAERLELSPEKFKLDAALRGALDQVFTEFVAKFQDEQQATKESDALSKRNQGGDKEQCPRALLRGKLSIDGSGRASWKGAWAFSKVEWDKGERSSFRFLSKDKWEAACLEDGRWVAFGGHFMMRIGGSSQRREKEKFAKLRFVRNEEGKFSVAGKGKNGFGAWRLELGIYEPQSGRLSARRAYEDSASDSRAIAPDALLASDDEEDEDFDAYDEDEDNEQQAFSFGPHVAMRGELRFEAEQWVWRGEWGATGDALEAGDVGRFQYTGPGEQTLPLKLNLSGSFELHGPNGTRDVAEPRLCLRFAGSRVKGRGHNEFGDFTIVGQLDEDHTLSCSKKYASNEDDDDIENDDFVDDREALAEELADLAAEAAEAGTAGADSRRKRRSAAGDERIANKRCVARVLWAPVGPMRERPSALETALRQRLYYRPAHRDPPTPPVSRFDQVSPSYHWTRRSIRTAQASRRFAPARRQ